MTARKTAALGLAITCLFAWPSLVAAQSNPSGYIHGVWNPEDLVRLPNSSWVVVSAMRSAHQPGGLLAVDIAHPESATPLYPTQAAIANGPEPKEFAPHGLDARQLDDGRYELLVVDHSSGETIDRFTIKIREGQSPAIESVTRIAMPPAVWANGVAAMPDGGFVLTSMYDPRDKSFIAKFAAAEITGGIWRWSQANGWSALPQPQLSGANGIAVSRDGNTIFAAEWAAHRIWRIPLDGSEAHSVHVDFLPDNLRWTSNGELLIAGQMSTPQDLFSCVEQSRPCPMGFTVARVDPATLAVEPLLHGGATPSASSQFGGATGALEVRQEIWVGSFIGDRIARFATSPIANAPER